MSELPLLIFRIDPFDPSHVTPCPFPFPIACLSCQPHQSPLHNPVWRLSTSALPLFELLPRPCPIFASSCSRIMPDLSPAPALHRSIPCPASAFHRPLSTPGFYSDSLPFLATSLLTLLETPALPCSKFRHLSRHPAILRVPHTLRRRDLYSPLYLFINRNYHTTEPPKVADW